MYVVSCKRSKLPPDVENPMTEALLEASPHLTPHQIKKFNEAFAIFLLNLAGYNGQQSAVITTACARIGTETHFSRSVPFTFESKEKIRRAILSQVPDETNEQINAMIKITEKITLLAIKYLTPVEMAFMAPATAQVLIDYKVGEFH